MGRTRTYTAYSQDPKVIDRVLMKLEGLYTSLKAMPPDVRPKAITPLYVASHLGCTTGTVKRWIHYHNQRRDEHELSERFCDIYELIANTLAEVACATALTIATDPTNSQALAASKWLLPKIDPWTFGDQGAAETKSTTTADIPSEKFDALTDEQRARLQAISDEHDRLAHETEKILESAPKSIDDDL